MKSTPPHREIVSSRIHPDPLAAYQQRGPARRSAFTLVEVMATMMLMAIVLPSVNQGIATATLAATTARRHTEAAGLAQSKLTELITNGTWQGGTLSGDCGPDWPDYRWQATLSTWANDPQAVGMQQLDVQILWTARSRPESITVSGLVYVRPVATS